MVSCILVSRTYVEKLFVFYKPSSFFFTNCRPWGPELISFELNHVFIFTETKQIYVVNEVHHFYIISYSTIQQKFCWVCSELGMWDQRQFLFFYCFKAIFWTLRCIFLRYTYKLVTSSIYAVVDVTKARKELSIVTFTFYPSLSVTNDCEANAIMLYKSSLWSWSSFYSNFVNLSLGHH